MKKKIIKIFLELGCSAFILCMIPHLPDITISCHQTSELSTSFSEHPSFPTPSPEPTPFPSPLHDGDAYNS